MLATAQATYDRILSTRPTDARSETQLQKDLVKVQHTVANLNSRRANEQERQSTLRAQREKLLAAAEANIALQEQEEVALDQAYKDMLSKCNDAIRMKEKDCRKLPQGPVSSRPQHNEPRSYDEMSASQVSLLTSDLVGALEASTTIKQLGDEAAATVLDAIKQLCKTEIEKKALMAAPQPSTFDDDDEITAPTKQRRLRPPHSESSGKGQGHARENTDTTSGIMPMEQAEQTLVETWNQAQELSLAY